MALGLSEQSEFLCVFGLRSYIYPLCKCYYSLIWGYCDYVQQNFPSKIIYEFYDKILPIIQILPFHLFLALNGGCEILKTCVSVCCLVKHIGRSRNRK